MIAKKITIEWHPGMSIFASEPFLQAAGDEYGWLGGFDTAGQLCCILPYTIIKKGFFRLVRFRIETIAIQKNFAVQEEKRFLNSVMGFFRDIDADMIIPATTNTVFRTYPDGATAAPYGTYLIDLHQQEDTLWSNLNTSHRRNIRRAKNSGVVIKDGMPQMKTVYTLVWETFKRSSIPFMKYDDFQRMVASLGENIKIFIAEHQGEIQGCTVVPFSLHRAYYVYGGSAPQPVPGANNLLHWHAIEQFKSLGVNHYDFVGARISPTKGSKQEGLMTFKKRFGAELVQGYMWKYPLHRLSYTAYSMAVRLLRGGDIVDAEKHKLNKS
jgi:hypothetical protein